MKRFFFSFFLVIFIFLGIFLLQEKFGLFSPALGGGDESEITEISAVGTLKSFGSFAAKGAGTHFIEKTDGSVLLLTGLGVNLDPYIGQKIEVRGRMAKTPSGKDLMQVISVGPAPVEKVEVTPTDPQTGEAVTPVNPQDTSWSPFLDSKLGVSFQKRNNWNLKNNGKTLSLELLTSEQKRDLIDIKRFSNPEKKPLGQQLQLLTKNLSPVQSKIGIDGLDALEYRYDIGIIEVYLVRDEYLYMLSYAPFQKVSGDVHRNDFYELLSTFRFVPIQ
ncbi:MAG: hypothetical protein AAB551_01175 [Patescibacteria group bacterium]